MVGWDGDNDFWTGSFKTQGVHCLHACVCATCIHIMCVICALILMVAIVIVFVLAILFNSKPAL